ncbi:MAG: hypothetical protein KAS07_01815 [Candidatus Pacebacteria bacterium]|nr:hypothetical protein [Candidatus Paceibacterota bacterium]
MALPKTPKQCAIRIGSLKKQLIAMEKRKKALSSTVKKKTVRKVARKPVRRTVKRTVKKTVKRRAAPKRRR